MSITSDLIREHGFIHALADEAADEIDMLESRVERLKAELREITEALDDERINNTMTAEEVAREMRAEIERLRAELDAVFLAQIELAPKIAEALAAERKLTIESILRGLRSEDDTLQVRAIIASVEAMLPEEPQ